MIIYTLYKGLTVVSDTSDTDASLTNNHYITTRAQGDDSPLRISPSKFKYLINTSELLEWDDAWTKHKGQRSNIDHVVFYPSLDACLKAIDRFCEENPEYFV